MNYVWEYSAPSEEQGAKASELAKSLGISPVLGRLLLERGITTAEEARAFFRPQLSELLDPFLFKDMDKAVARLNAALGRKERILVYGDYDVDGCTAVALVYRFLQQYYSNIDYYIPDRNEEGYGVSRKGVDYAAETGVGLVIVLDCGIKAVEEIAYALERGIDFIICDHHVPDEVLPPAVAILNAKREDDTYPYKHLSGCGVGFKFMQAFAQNNGIEFSQLVPLLDLCAISIASDIVPIMGENRILACHGLRQLNSAPSTGVKALMEVCGLADREISLSNIIFKIGPRINASGRMQNGKEAVTLLVEKNYKAARQMAERINAYNEQRKDLDKAMTEQANHIVETLDLQHKHKSIVLYSEEWHRGIIGIVASRLTEIYHRPSVVLTRTDDVATGSARSVPGFDVYGAVAYCRDLLENFGGHTYAAGLSMKVENVPEFRRRFEGEEINKILTIEASGIGMACIAAQHFGGVPVVFAKKAQSINLDGEQYATTIYSFTKQKEYPVIVGKRFLSEGDKVLIIDDFLANGCALEGLIKICEAAGAEVAGIGIAVEKGFQGGGDKLRERGFRVESLARIAEMDCENGEITFA